jgi:hypothetical protein
MQSYDGRQWWPEYQPPKEPGPERAAYRIHSCFYCGLPTHRDTACSKCLATRFAWMLHHLHEEVRNGLRSDWPLLPHVQYQIDHTCRAHTIPVQTFFASVIARAEARGFIYDGTTGEPEPPIFYPDERDAA